MCSHLNWLKVRSNENTDLINGLSSMKMQNTFSILAFMTFIIMQTVVSQRLLAINTVQIHFQNTANFLWTIFQRNNYPVRIVYIEMLEYPFEENWANGCQELEA